MNRLAAFTSTDLAERGWIAVSNKVRLLGSTDWTLGGKVTNLLHERVITWTSRWFSEPDFVAPLSANRSISDSDYGH